MACSQGSSSPSAGHLLAPEKPPLPAGRGASQGGPDAPAPAVSCLGKAKLAGSGPKRPCGGFYMRHSETGQILPARCNSHLCPECSPLHQMTARHALEIGMVRRCIERGRDCVVWLTLTDTSRGDLDLHKLTKQWASTVKWLRRNWGAGEYALTREFQDRGALHPHVCIEVSDEVADDLMDRRSRASYVRRMHELRPMAEANGWGQMVDAVTVDGISDMQKVARYAAKSVAGYATKEAAEKFKRAGARRVRPISLSYGWYPDGLAGARRQVLAQPKMSDSRIEGKWERIPKPRTC